MQASSLPLFLTSCGNASLLGRGTYDRLSPCHFSSEDVATVTACNNRHMVKRVTELSNHCENFPKAIEWCRHVLKWEMKTMCLQNCLFLGDALWVVFLFCMLPHISHTIYDGLVSNFFFTLKSFSMYFLRPRISLFLSNHSKVTEIRKFNIDTEPFTFICKFVSYHAPPIYPGSKPEFHGLYYFFN